MATYRPAFIAALPVCVPAVRPVCVLATLACCAALVFATVVHADPIGDRSGRAFAESRAAQLDSIVWTALASSGIAFTSIDSVKCTELECEIRFTGSDDLMGLSKALFKAGWDPALRGWPVFKQGSFGQDPRSPGTTLVRISTRCPVRDLYVGPACPE